MHFVTHNARMNIRNIRTTLILCFFLCLSGHSVAAEFEPFGMALLRYESETGTPERERLRLIVQGGYKVKLTDSWSAVGRLSTGLKNKQNVPAITIKRFSTQAQPDGDVYIDQAFMRYKQGAWDVKIGRVPWSFAAATDTFWDRNLNPYTFYVEHKVNKNHKFSGAYIKPLDGHSDSVGDMYISQYQFSETLYDIVWSFKPWLVIYNGEADARYAKRDTQYDHRSMRLAAAAKYQAWQLAMDLGYAFDTEEQDNVSAIESGQDTSIVTELSYGRLKSVNDWQWHVRYMHVERFSVITEFAQNALAAKLTSNFSGWDTRFRYRVHPDIWVGARLSIVESLVGSTLKSKRFRVEARWAF